MGVSHKDLKAQQVQEENRQDKDFPQQTPLVAPGD